MNANRVSLLIPKPGAIEHWSYANGGGGGDRPIHLHFEEGITMNRGGVRIPATIETAYHIHAQRHDEGEGECSVDHTSVIHIMDPAGRFVGLVSNLMTPERLARRLTQIVKWPRGRNAGP